MAKQRNWDILIMKFSHPLWTFLSKDIMDLKFRQPILIPRNRRENIVIDTNINCMHTPGGLS